MNWKSFIKPDGKKIMLATALLLLTSFLIGQIGAMYGFPLTFYNMGKFCGAMVGVECGPSISYLNLVVDIVFWYAASCLLLTHVIKPRGRKK